MHGSSNYCTRNPRAIHHSSRPISRGKRRRTRYRLTITRINTREYSRQRRLKRFCQWCSSVRLRTRSNEPGKEQDVTRGPLHYSNRTTSANRTSNKTGKKRRTTNASPTISMKSSSRLVVVVVVAKYDDYVCVRQIHILNSCHQPESSVAQCTSASEQHYLSEFPNAVTT